VEGLEGKAIALVVLVENRFNSVGAQRIVSANIGEVTSNVLTAFFGGHWAGNRFNQVFLDTRRNEFDNMFQRNYRFDLQTQNVFSSGSFIVIFRSECSFKIRQGRINEIPLRTSAITAHALRRSAPFPGDFTTGIRALRPNRRRPTPRNFPSIVHNVEKSFRFRRLLKSRGSRNGLWRW